MVTIILLYIKEKKTCGSELQNSTLIELGNSTLLRLQFYAFEVDHTCNERSNHAQVKGPLFFVYHLVVPCNTSLNII